MSNRKSTIKTVRPSNDENGDWVRLAEDAEEQASIASRRARDLKKAAAIFRANAKQIPLASSPSAGDRT